MLKVVIVQNNDFGYSVKLWMVNKDKQAVFGEGVARLLEEIDKHRSIVKAAECTSMSYRYALHRITLAEKRLNQPLVKRSHGGAKGGSSEVTLYGKEVISKYRKAQFAINNLLKTLP